MEGAIVVGTAWETKSKSVKMEFSVKTKFWLNFPQVTREPQAWGLVGRQCWCWHARILLLIPQLPSGMAHLQPPGRRAEHHNKQQTGVVEPSKTEEAKALVIVLFWKKDLRAGSV